MPDDGSKRLAIVGVASLFLVAMVVGVTIGVNNSDKTTNESELAASRKAVDNICQPTDYKQTCKDTLHKAAPNTDNPNELVKAAFNAALEEINEVSERSALLKELEKDPKTSKATQDCKTLFNDASDDFRRSVDQVGTFDLSNMDKILSNLKVWLSATVTYQETCLDGFENTTEAGEKMRKMLNTSMQMSANGIAIVSGMSQAVGDLHLNTLSSGSRRLLGLTKNRRLMTWYDEFVVGHPEFVDDEFLERMSRENERNERSLVSSEYNDEVIPRWLDMDDKRRKLLQATTINDLKPDVVVAQDGSGKYKKIGDSFNEIPKNGNEPFVIFVKEGIYKEYLRLEKWHTNVVLVGAGPTKTRITGNLNFIDGTPTFQTCTFAALGDHVLMKDIGIENTAGPEKHQAVALRVQADQSIFYNCHFDGYQDTLYTHTYRQYYRDCQISGTIDFIFGDAAAFFQNCTFVIRKPLDNQNCIVTAQGRKERHQPSGIIIHKSNFVADPDYFPLRFKNKAYLGRPWKEYSKTIIMESHIDDLIQADGWLPWEGDFGLNSCYYGEYRNEGPGSNMEHRVKWPGIKTILPKRAEKFMPPIFYEGDDWIKASGVPYIPDLTTDPASFTAPPGSHDEDPNAAIVIPSRKKDKKKSKSDDKDKDKKKDKDKDKKKDKDKEKDKDKKKEKDKDKDEDEDEDEDESKSKSKSKDKSSDDSSSKSKSKDKSSDDSSSKSKSKDKSSDDSSSKSKSKSKDKSSDSKNSSSKETSAGISVDIPKESSSDSTSDSSSKPPNGSSTEVEAPAPASMPSQDLSTSPVASAQAPAPTPTPTSIISEAPTTSPSLPPEPAQGSSAPIENPSSRLVNLERTLLSTLGRKLTQAESPTISPSTPSESPSFLFNLEKKLMQTNDDNDDDNDDNDDHDKLVTTNDVSMDSVLEKLHLKTRSDISVDQKLRHAGAPSPGPSSKKQSKHHTSEAPSPSPSTNKQSKHHKSEAPSSSPSTNKLSKHHKSEAPSPSPSTNKLSKNHQSKAPSPNPSIKTNHKSPSPSPSSKPEMNKATMTSINDMVKNLHLGSSNMESNKRVKDLERELMEFSISKKEGEAAKPDAQTGQAAGKPNAQNGQDAAMAQLAASPEFAKSMAQANKNGTAINQTALANAPGASQIFSQFGINSTSLPQSPPGSTGEKAEAKKSGSNATYEIRVGFTLIALLIVLFV